MKRTVDIVIAALALIVASPLLVLVMIAIWAQDFASPFYIAPRMARGGGIFRMVKFRSMVVNADKTGVISTANNDRRITSVGKFVRKYKIDEIVQLWNVLLGDMSLVGPRPQVKVDADLYTKQEEKLLSVRPGITDPASIVFADEGDILKDSKNPNLSYNQVIRPWKSRLSLLYIEHGSLMNDFRLIVLTIISIFSRRAALDGLQKLLLKWGADELVCRMAARTQPLLAYPPPGASEIAA